MSTIFFLNVELGLQELGRYIEERATLLVYHSQWGESVAKP